MAPLKPYKNAQDVETRVKRDLFALAKSQREWKNPSGSRADDYDFSFLWASVMAHLEILKATENIRDFHQMVSAGYGKRLSNIVINFANSGLNVGSSEDPMVRPISLSLLDIYFSSSISLSLLAGTPRSRHWGCTVC